jgi:pyruvate formate lyase activating enzyme
MRKEASYYITLKDKKVKCTLCPHTCVISNGQRGVCGVRENQQGVLITLVYDHPCAINIDPIEKKPLNHFLPGSVSLSIGTAGCNLSCMYCQNWNMSKALPENIRCYTTTSDEILEMAKNSECASISYTYNEPSMNFEFVLEAARKAHTHRLKNVMVTNGFINQKPLKELYQYIDAANVDLKGFNQQFYKEICGASLNPVLESIKTMREMHIWLEITNLIIPTYNDNQDDIKKACQ